MEELSGVLGKYAGGGGAQASEEEVHRDFDQVTAQGAHPGLADGLAAAFRSDKTPPFAHMLGSMFGHGNPQQRAGLLNTLIEAAGGGVAGRVLGGGLGQAGRLSAQDAQRISPDAARALAHEAEQRDPSVVDRVSQFSAGHPGLVKSLGTAALSLVLAHVARRHD
jgi:hypothetical protein